MQMKMCHWGHGLLDLRLNILMTETSVVVLLQVKKLNYYQTVSLLSMWLVSDGLSSFFDLHLDRL